MQLQLCLDFINTVHFIKGIESWYKAEHSDRKLRRALVSSFNLLSNSSVTYHHGNTSDVTIKENVTNLVNTARVREWVGTEKYLKVQCYNYIPPPPLLSNPWPLHWKLHCGEGVNKTGTSRALPKINLVCNPVWQITEMEWGLYRFCIPKWLWFC